VSELTGGVISELDNLIAQVLDLIYFQFDLFNSIIKGIKDVILAIPSIVVYMPAIAVGCMLLLGLLRIFIPPLAYIIQLSILASALYACTGITFAVLFIRRLLLAFNIAMVVTWNYSTVIIDLVTLSLMIVSLLLLFFIEIDPRNLTDPVLMKIIREFELDLHYVTAEEQKSKKATASTWYMAEARRKPEGSGIEDVYAQMEQLITNPIKTDSYNTGLHLRQFKEIQ
jgi:hypothetical protein